ncbi:CGNR zinc finger domain-containing protein [Actinoplanes sp. NPDC051851]|uniref:CGNR zinc finger domain-containing protein n=1 Tax=Actinoplanes sp. NPDC051851 TaxID=3154753 RepID=UPI00342672B9
MSIDVATLPLVGGHAALDLVNTVTPRVAVRGETPRDHLAVPEDLLVWSRRAGLTLSGEEAAIRAAWHADPGAAPAALEAVREIREALHDALTGAGRSGVALDRLHLRWSAATARARLALDKGRPVVRVGEVPAHAVPDRAADAAVALIRTADLTALRRCPVELGGCGWLFLDLSRNRTRRWCRMADCGTTAKSHRLTERRRAARAEGLPVSGD